MEEEEKGRVQNMMEHLDEVSKYKVFAVKYNNNEGNRAVHEAFISFCWSETDGNYLQGIKRLLENYNSDYRYELLSNEIEVLKQEISSKETSVNKGKEAF